MREAAATPTIAVSAPVPPVRPPRHEPHGADWFLDGGRIREVMGDPRELAARMLKILPREALAVLLAFDTFKLSGSVTLNINGGTVGAVQQTSHHRLNGDAK